MMSQEHFPGAIPECRPWPGRGAVKGVSPGGRPIPSRTFTGGTRTGLDMREGRPGGVLWTLDGGVPAQGYTLGRDGSGLYRHPVIRCRLLMPGLGVGKREKRGER
jgi:hypothetical protein